MSYYPEEVMVSLGERVLICTEVEAKIITAYCNALGDDKEGVINWFLFHLPLGQFEVDGEQLINALRGAYERPLRHHPVALEPKLFVSLDDHGIIVTCDTKEQLERVATCLRHYSTDPALQKRVQKLGPVIDFHDLREAVGSAMPKMEQSPAVFVH